MMSRTAVLARPFLGCLAISSIADLHGAVIATRCDSSPIGRPGHGSDRTGVPFEREQLSAVGHVPYLQCATIAARGQPRSIR